MGSCSHRPNSSGEYNSQEGNMTYVSYQESKYKLNNKVVAQTSVTACQDQTACTHRLVMAGKVLHVNFTWSCHAVTNVLMILSV